MNNGIVMFDKILVVCVGNICRSPLGEYLLESLLPNKKVVSAGVGALVGEPADKFAMQVAIDHGINLGGHHAQQLTADLCRDFDLILVMEQEHIDAVTEIFAEARGKTMLFAYWLDQQTIPDPYRQNKQFFEQTYQLLEASAVAWAKKLI